MRRRRARCSLQGCPRNGAVCGYAALHRARAGGAALQVHARAVVRVAWASPRAASTATLVFGRALPQIECENGGGFCLQERVEGSVERCEGREELCVGALLP